MSDSFLSIGSPLPLSGLALSGKRLPLRARRHMWAHVGTCALLVALAHSAPVARRGVAGFIIEQVPDFGQLPTSE